MTIMSSREFNQDTSGAKRAASEGPVFITDRGKPSHVLLSMDEYLKLAKKGNIIDALAMPGGEDIDFEPPRMTNFSPKPVDLS
ncbi:type II toxin-antitoxin system prevent-host-death family antitoxin [Rhizobium sp. CB3090]|uniref:type II toxin-antitoxin system prevent-host-death family antitoxin n=1 Tax=Rhizobium sp. CB3090 TaxID=3039156 RepID=UPI0024B0F280|nr:type II toxin-antitoxin system prevent-host-death family antitoxin [Rhizobium sp. CB3090]WFU07828.1 type II toxin-antitoxin system prevent-host-death family antitoxin [Rhizobium sp. CB3090]